MSPEAMIAGLDAALEAAGEDIVLRRISATAPTNVDVTIKAHVQSYRLREQELVNGVFQDILLVTTSPTELIRTNWPGVSPQIAGGIDQLLPRKNDQVIVHGRTRNIDVVEVRYVLDEIVRINMSVMG